MPKSHVVKLMITNKTPFIMNYRSAWFDSGRLADGEYWPKQIIPGPDGTGVANIECYESDNALAGCSGYVTYEIGYENMLVDMTIAFSNPAAGTNKLGLGIGGKAVWDKMGNHDYGPFEELVTIEGRDRPLTILGECQCTGGEVNQARILLTLPSRRYVQALR